MGLIADIEILRNACTKIESKARGQQKAYFLLVTGLVKMGQSNRIARNYITSDAIRQLLKDVGVTVIQGTNGYAYDDIPESLRGRQVDDTWKEADE